jgi:hypothetical protein
MTVDPTDPDIIENDPDSTEAAADAERDEVPAEAPEADAAEQHADLAPVGEDRRQGDLGLVNEADLAEQARVVELDEDDYR